MPSGIGWTQGGSRPYRKYRPLPALILIALLGAVSVFVWVKALGQAVDVNEAIRCNPPASPPPGMTFTPVGHDALDNVSPIPPNKVNVQVLNASKAKGQAAIVSEELRQLGFSKIARPDDDPAYENRRADCRGQIRYGENGERAARTLSLIDSCVELIKDNRKDATVDLSIGTAFGDVAPRAEARKVFDQLTAWSERNSGRGGSELAASTKVPELSKDLLDSARGTEC